MSSWEGFTTRLRHHARGVMDRTTRGYLTVAADRIEDLEGKLADAKAEAQRLSADIARRREMGQ